METLSQHKYEPVYTVKEYLRRWVHIYIKTEHRRVSIAPHL